MEIRCFATLPIEQDEPVPCIRQFVRVLRTGIEDSARATVDLNLIGTSKRALTTLREFQPASVRGLPFARALEITEELTNLGPGKVKSLHFLLTAEGFRWRGSSPEASATLALLDGKSFQRKQRFSLYAHLVFEASDAEDPSITKMLEQVAAQTGIRFQKEVSLMRFKRDEPGRVTAEELFVTTLAWQELVESVGQKLQEAISLDGIPHLMTAPQAHNFLFDPAKFGKSVPVNFGRIARKWQKDEFPDFRLVAGAWEGESLQKEIAPGLNVVLRLDKRGRAFSKEFTIGLGIGLSSPRFAPTPERPFELAANLFQFFGIGPLPWQWTYHTEADLREALQACSRLVKQVLATFEPKAATMQDAYRRNLKEFAGPRELSAREAYAVALPLAEAWNPDAAATRVVSSNSSGPYLSAFHFLQAPQALPALSDQGRSAMNGGWYLSFYSRKKEEMFNTLVPCYGPIRPSRLDAPHGRQWPSDTDRILREGWLDSTEALGIARAKIQPAVPTNQRPEIQLFELESRANVRAGGVLRPPLRDGMFKMEPAWRISFSWADGRGRTIATVTIPAYADAEPTVEVRAFGKQGRPSRP